MFFFARLLLSIFLAYIFGFYPTPPPPITLLMVRQVINQVGELVVDPHPLGWWLDHFIGVALFVTCYYDVRAVVCSVVIVVVVVDSANFLLDG